MAELITIGITAFNAGTTVERAVRSALAQDYPVFEIVAFDDASTDDTAARLAGFGDRIRLLHGGANRGVAHARNQVIAAAKGAVIAFFDDDDESAADRLTKQYDRLVRYESAFAGDAPVVCHAARLQIYPDGAERYAGTMGMDESRIAPRGRAVIDRIFFNEGGPETQGALATCSQMARRAVYEAAGGFDENFRRAEDTDFALRLAAAGGHFVGIAEPLVRQTMTLAADKHLAEDRRCALQLFEKHRALFGARAAYQRRWLELKYDLLMGRRRSFLAGFAALALRHPLRTLRQARRALPNAGHRRQKRRHHAGH